MSRIYTLLVLNIIKNMKLFSEETLRKSLGHQVVDEEETWIWIWRNIFEEIKILERTHFCSLIESKWIN